MKSATEKRLLFALLLSSLVPLTLLGFGASSAVHKLRLELARGGEQAALARARGELLARCYEASSGISAYFVSTQADLRTVATTPRTAEAYLKLCDTALAPRVGRRGSKGGRPRYKYQEIAFFAPDGRQLVGIRGGEAAAPSELLELSDSGPAASSWRECFVRTQALQSGDISLSPSPKQRERGKTLLVATPVYGARGSFEGIAGAAVDPEPLQKLLSGFVLSGLPAKTEAWGLFFDDTGRVICRVQSRSPRTDARPRRGEEGPLADLSAVLGQVRVGRGGTLDRTASGGAPLLVAYSPVFADYQGPTPRSGVLGGVALFRSAEREVGREAEFSARADSLARRAELQSLALTLVCALWVGFAGFIAARRMARPWIRLREKVSLAAPGIAPASPRAHDEVQAISDSFEALASHVEQHAGRLRATEERLREFIEMCPDGIAVIDPAGRLLLTNRSLCQMLRRSPGELGGFELREAASDPVEVDEMLRRIAEKARLKDYELELRRADGSTFAAVFTLRLAQYEGSTRVEAIVRDVSALKEAQHRDREKTEELFRVHGELSRAHEALRGAFGQVEEQVRVKTSELQKAYEALQTSDRVKTEFLMKMSHELRTPLNCIIGYSEAMTEGLDGPVTDEQTRSLGRIAQSGRRLLRMIEDLLDLSRLESGGMEFRLADVRLEDLLDEVVLEMRSLVGDRAVEFQILVGEPLPPVWADPDRVRQVLFNLFGNALKFTDRGYIKIEAFRAEGAFIEVRVSDTGPGIPEGHLEKIFHRFVQLPNRNRTGAGLGLPICRELVERMGGTIWAESPAPGGHEHGRGSTFAFTLPVATSRSQLSLPFGSESSC
ncbi:MAG: PAS domain S-box protein [Deltaproteobacteria bacterium]|nr:PAS domain S-box protein [Deltaproteobacteria bacterium]